MNIAIIIALILGSTQADQVKNKKTTSASQKSTITSQWIPIPTQQGKWRVTTEDQKTWVLCPWV